MPKVSVIIPTYNNAKYISDAVESVFNQTFKDYEIIVIDDGSIDNTKEVLKKYESKITYLHHQNNKGPSTARNTGIINSSGKFIAFLDADDIWVPNKLELQMKTISQFSEIGLLGCGAYMIDESGNIIKERKVVSYSNRKLLLQDLMIRNVICGGCSGAVIKKECFDKVGLFDDGFRGSEDRDVWFRIAKLYEIKFLQQPLVKIRNHETNAHRNVEIMKCGKRKFICKHLKDMDWLHKQKAYSYIYSDAAGEYYDASKRGLALTNSFTAIIQYPFKIYENDHKYQIFIKSIFPYSLIKNVKRFIFLLSTN